MLRKLFTGIALCAALAVTLFLAACAASGGQRIDPTWITPALSGNNIAIPIAMVQQDTIAHFWVNTPDGRESFMAYQYDGTTYIRADVCVPCRSYNFSLQGNILVCDTCGTRFSATTGKGVSGPCQSYAKAEVKWQMDNGNLMASVSDLQTAYRNTVNRTTG